jgi:hypothetical protein
MEGAVELTNTADPKTTYFMKDGAIVAWRVMSTECGCDVERWYIGGNLGRLGDLPAEIWYKNGQKTGECWYKDGKKHRDGDLSAAIWYNNGQKTGECWYKDGNLHRDGDLPASIHYKNGQKTSEYWYKNGYMHHDGDLPASIHYKNGQKTYERWYKDGEEHRVNKRPVKTQQGDTAWNPAESEMTNLKAELAEIKAILRVIVAELVKK